MGAFDLGTGVVAWADVLARGGPHPHDARRVDGCGAGGGVVRTRHEGPRSRFERHRRDRALAPVVAGPVRAASRVVPSTGTASWWWSPTTRAHPRRWGSTRRRGRSAGGRWAWLPSSGRAPMWWSWPAGPRRASRRPSCAASNANGGQERWTSGVLFNDGWGTVWESYSWVPAHGVDADCDRDRHRRGALDGCPRRRPGGRRRRGRGGRRPRRGRRVSLDTLDADTGEALWSTPGQSSYGDLLAMGDEALVVMDAAKRGPWWPTSSPRGEERWRTATVGGGRTAADRIGTAGALGAAVGRASWPWSPASTARPRGPRGSRCTRR